MVDNKQYLHDYCVKLMPIVEEELINYQKDKHRRLDKKEINKAIANVISFIKQDNAKELLTKSEYSPKNTIKKAVYFSLNSEGMNI